jgi:hypothetical protein
MSELILDKGGVFNQKPVGQDPLQVLNQVNNNKLLPLLSMMDKAVPIISQVLAFVTMRELFHARDNRVDENGNSPIKVPMNKKLMIYMMNMISIQQFFQPNNDLGRTFGAGLLTLSYGRSLFGGMAEANIGSLWNNFSFPELPEINWDELLNKSWEMIMAEVKSVFNISGVPTL